MSDRQPCPVCGEVFPIDELPVHVDLHFQEGDPQEEVVDLLSEPEDSPAAAAPKRARPGPHLDDELVACPYGCGAEIPLSDLESHELAHCLQDTDAEVAVGEAERQLRDEEEAEQFEKLRSKYGFSDTRPGNCRRCGQTGHWSRECPDNPATRPPSARLPTDPQALAAAQRRELYTPLPGGGIIALISRCLRQQCIPGASSYLSGLVDHLSARPQDSGWGCGYRNAQMLSSHLLTRSPELAAALYGGCGFLPDVASLQAWVEAAWAAGYDAAGAESLGGQLQGSRKWVGTTEAAALLRLFGVRAEIVDFQDKKVEGAVVVCDVCEKRVGGTRWASTTRPNYDLCDTCHSRGAGDPQAAPFRPIYYTPGSPGPSRGNGGAASSSNPAPATQQQQQQQQQRQEARHKQLVEWVWRYFSTAPRAAGPAGASGRSGGGSNVGVMTSRAPLYLQHDGHSRTIVGIERRPGPQRGPSSGQPQYSLLVLDPGVSRATLERTLRSGVEWQKHLKRGLHTLHKPEYQLLYVVDGLIPPAEAPSWKVIKAAATYNTS